MAHHRVSWFVMLCVFVLDLIAFGLSWAAETRRAKGHVENDECVYDSDIATGLGVGAALFLLFSQIFITAATRCLCCGSPLMPGSSRAFAIIFFICSWLSFVIAELCMLVGAAHNAKHYHYRGYFHAQNLTCSSLRKGTFAAAAVFTLLSFIFNAFYYICHTSAREGQGSHGEYRQKDTGVRMAQYM